MPNPWDRPQQTTSMGNPWDRPSASAEMEPSPKPASMASRFYDNAIAPTVQIATDVLKKGGPQAVSDMVTGIKDKFVEGVNNSKGGGIFGPIGDGLYNATYGPQADAVVEDWETGRYGAAIGGAAGMAAPFMVPAAWRAAKNAQPVVGAAVKGAAKAVPSQIRPTLKKIDIFHPGRDVLALYDAGANIVKGGSAGVDAYRSGVEASKVPKPSVLGARVGKTRPVTPRTSPMADAILSDYAENYGGTSAKAQAATPVSSTPAVESSTYSRMSPELQSTAQQLADELGPQGMPPERPTVQFANGARAKKVWNMSDLLNEYGIPAEDAALMDDAQWGQLTEAMNKANAVDATGSKFNRHHLPSAQSRAQIVNELRDIEARRRTP